MSVTFQKMWKISVGEGDGEDFTPSFEITRHNFTASIQAEGKSTSSSETPPITTISLYNIGHELISTLSSNYNLYIKVQAGYLYSGSYNVATTYASLPIVFTGFVHYTETTRKGVDVVTTVHCTPAFDKLSKATINKAYAKGDLVNQIFKDLANSAKGLNLQLNFKEKDTLTLKSKKTVEGLSSVKLTELCHKWKLRSYIEDNTLYIVDKDAKVKKGGTVHKIPLQRVKGVIETSTDLAQVIKERSEAVPEVSFTTFLYPSIRLYDGVKVQIPDYSNTAEAGKPINTIEQEFVVMEYSHELDSGDGGTWETRIKGKGELNNVEK